MKYRVSMFPFTEAGIDPLYLHSLPLPSFKTRKNLDHQHHATDSKVFNPFPRYHCMAPIVASDGLCLGISVHSISSHHLNPVPSFNTRPQSVVSQSFGSLTQCNPLPRLNSLVRSNLSHTHSCFIIPFISSIRSPRPKICIETSGQRIRRIF